MPSREVGGVIPETTRQRGRCSWRVIPDKGIEQWGHSCVGTSEDDEGDDSPVGSRN